MSHQHIKKFENNIPAADYVQRSMGMFDKLEQTEPFDAAELNRSFQEEYEKMHTSLYEKRITVSGIVVFKGPDIHQIPSFELSNEKDGPCCVLCCLGSKDEYKDYDLGDTVIVEGNYLTANRDYGIVLKNCRVK